MGMFYLACRCTSRSGPATTRRSTTRRRRPSPAADGPGWPPPSSRARSARVPRKSRSHCRFVVALYDLVFLDPPPATVAASLATPLAALRRPRPPRGCCGGLRAWRVARGVGRHGPRVDAVALPPDPGGHHRPLPAARVRAVAARAGLRVAAGTGARRRPAVRHPARRRVRAERVGRDPPPSARLRRAPGVS